jgi:tetrahydromethanopterin S-methyltransferase subunit G
VHDDGDLDIPVSNREIALHLRTINHRFTLLENEVKDRLDSLETTVSNVKDGLDQRRFKAQDMVVGSLILPLVGGMLLFLLTKALG